MTKILKKIHENHFVYRDIKPENFLMRSGSNKIYIVDFGLAKRYLLKDEQNEKKLKHAKISDGHSLIGTPRYASVNSHMGLE